MPHRVPDFYAAVSVIKSLCGIATTWCQKGESLSAPNKEGALSEPITVSQRLAGHCGPGSGRLRVYVLGLGQLEPVCGYLSTRTLMLRIQLTPLVSTPQYLCTWRPSTQCRTREMRHAKRPPLAGILRGAWYWRGVLGVGCARSGHPALPLSAFFTRSRRRLDAPCTS